MAIIRPFKHWIPRVDPTAFVAETAVLIGDVEIAAQASVWYGCVLRGDVGPIRVGARSNIQDVSIIHTTGGVSSSIIGEDVTVGHRVIIHGALIGNGALIGMGAVLLDNCVIGEDALIAAGTVITPETIIPPRSLVRGVPGKVIRELREDELGQGREGAKKYLELLSAYIDAG